jgi:adenosylhomocysteinase
LKNLKVMLDYKEYAMKYDVKDLSLAKKGSLRIEWSNQNMPVLNLIMQRFKKEKPLQGMKLAACLPITLRPRAWRKRLKPAEQGAALCVNPPSTQDDVAAALVNYQIPVFAIKERTTKRIMTISMRSWTKTDYYHG